MKISVVSEMWLSSKILGSLPVRGLFSAKVPNSSFAEAHRVLLSEPTTWKMKMNIKRMKWKMRKTVKSAKWRVEENQDAQPLNAHETWMM